MTSKPTLLLLGGGGHAAVVADAASAAGWSIAGYLDNDDTTNALQDLGLMRLGGIADLKDALGALDRTAAAHAAVGDGDLRRQWLDRAGDAIAEAIVHPSAVVSPSAILEAGSFIGPRAIVNARAVVRRGAIVNSGAIVEHDCEVGRYSHIAPGAVLGGGAQIGPGALIGMNAAVLPGLRVGGGATLGAGAVAVGDIPPGVTAVGVPAVTDVVMASAKDRI